MKTFGDSRRRRPRGLTALWMTPGALLLMALAPWAVSAQLPSPVQTDSLKTVLVEAVCTNVDGRLGLGRVTVDPFSLYVPVPDEQADDFDVRWVIQGTADNSVIQPDSIIVQADTNQRWPFGPPSLVARNAGAPAAARARMLRELPNRGRGRRRRVARERFKYNILVFCPGREEPFVIDPDIDTGGGV